MNITKYLFRNTIVGWFEMMILIISALIITPLLITSLGKEGYGVWVLTGQVIAYLFMLDLGVSSSVGRFVAKYNAKSDYPGLARIVNSSLFLFLASSILIAIVTLMIYPNFSKFFHLSDEYFNVGRWLILLMGLSVALSFPLKVGQGMLEGIHRFDLIYFLRASGALINLLLIITFFGWFRYQSLLLLAVITIAVTIIPNLFMCRFAYNKFSNIIKVSFKYIKFSDLREIFSLSLSTLLGTIASLFLRQSQVIAVGRIMGSSAVTIYSIPVMMLTYASMIISYMAAAFKPMASHMQALDDRQRLQKLNIEGVKVAFIIGLFIAVISIMFGNSFFRIWLSSNNFTTNDFTQLKNVLIIMVIGFAIGIPQTVTDKMFTGTDKQWFVAITSLMTSLIGLFVGILLMAKTNLFLYGMAIGWTTVFFISGVLIYPVSACNFFKIRLSSYIWQAYLTPIIAATILIIIILPIKKIFNVSSFMSLASFVIFSLIVYATTVYFICLDREQKTQIWSITNKIKSRIS